MRFYVRRHKQPYFSLAKATTSGTRNLPVRRRPSSTAFSFMRLIQQIVLLATAKSVSALVPSTTSHKMPRPLLVPLHFTRTDSSFSFQTSRPQTSLRMSPLDEASALLSAYNSASIEALKRDKQALRHDRSRLSKATLSLSSSLYDITTPRAPADSLMKLSNEWVANAPRETLAAAVRTILADASHNAVPVRLGVCASDAMTAIATLGTWVQNLNLPRGLIYGADVDGEQINLDEFGGAYIKYSRSGSLQRRPEADVVRREKGDSGAVRSSSRLSSGDAVLSPYGGGLRGVHLTVGSGARFRQYSVLPLDLFDTKMIPTDEKTGLR